MFSFRGPTQKTALAKVGRGFFLMRERDKKNEGEWTGKVKMKTFLAADEAYMAIF